MSKRITITLDDAAADALRQMAASPRRQGEFVSRLIRQAARAANSDISREVAKSAGDLTTIANRLLELAGRPTSASGGVDDLPPAEEAQAEEEAEANPS